MRDDGLNDGRLKADQRLVELLAEHDFTGPVYREFAEELAGYGIAVLTGWMRSGLIFVRCAEKGIKLLPPTFGWSEDDQLELTLETTALAINSFRRSLIEGRWHADGGASLRTYFTGSCIYQFAKVFKAWLRLSGRETEQPMEIDERLADEILGPEETAVRRDEARRALHTIHKDTTRTIVVLEAEGFSHAEIAELIGCGTTARSVEGVLYRHRRRMKGGAPS